ncbi:MAG: Gfo/Idh/MocA family oxidoreductase, partial [Planctomycetes bacterium]|nr:Gfo/Idh/MocA family oxidoreductase [Planctomycetota bacterium]
MQRRDFLRSSAALSSGLFLSSRGLARIAPQAPAELEVAVIGVGTQGLQLLKSCARIAGVRVRAVCDVWDFHRDRAVQRLEQQGLEVAAYEDHRALLDAEKSLDAAIVATPDFLHVPQAADCLERGLHVYCERPISNEVEAARRLVQAAARAGRQLQIGHQRRSNPRYIHCAEKLLGEIQLLGKIAAGSGQWNRSVDIDRGWPRRREIEPATLERIGFRSMQEFRNWRWYRRLGSGPFVEHGSDQIDVFHWFLGARPTAVYASGGTDYYDPESHEWPDTVLSIFEFRSLERPARVFYQTITTNGDYGHFEKLLGDEGTLMITESSGRVGVFREAAAPSWEKWVRLEYLAETE